MYNSIKVSNHNIIMVQIFLDINIYPIKNTSVKVNQFGVTGSKYKNVCFMKTRKTNEQRSKRFFVSLLAFM